MKVFYSYCHADEEHRKKLEQFLVPLRDAQKITEWYDGKILAGEKWEEKIKQNLEDSDIVLLLISQDFLNSTACKEELAFALDSNNKKTVIPVILKPCTWQETDLKNIQAVPKDAKPIVEWDVEEKAWLDVVEKIKSTIDSLANKPKQKFLDEINETEFRNSGYDSIKLSDIFVNPKFEFSTIDGKNDEKIFSFTEFVSDKNKYSLISGEYLSGKTSILYRIFTEAVQKNFFPVFVDGNTVKQSLNFDKCIQKSINEEYENIAWDVFCKKGNKIILIDNYTHRISDNFITYCKETFDYIYIAIDSNEQLLFFKDSRLFADFNNNSIKGVGHASKYELIKNWKSLERNNFTTDEQFQNEIENLEQNINSIILDKNILPNTPFHILTIIQSFETFMPQNFQITSYGHCYYAIIYAQLRSIGLSQTDIDDSLNYLTYLAKSIFDGATNNQWILLSHSYKDFKDGYKKEYLITDSLVARLEDERSSILKIDDEKVSFSYPFIFYYFLGKYLAFNKEKNIVENLCSKIYNKDYANILIFTIHHAIDTDLLDEIELYCLVSLEKFKIAKLTVAETAFMNGLMSTLPGEIKRSHSERTTEERRILLRKEQDMLEEQTEDIETVNLDEYSDPEIIDIERSMKIIEVLGQIIKNRSGSFKMSKIKELICEVEKLGLRILTYFLDTLKNPEFKDWISERIYVLEKERDQSFDKEKIEKIVEQNIQMMGFVIIIGMLQKTYSALTTQKILPLQEEISGEEDSVAFDFLLLFFKLSYEGLKFDYIEHYYKKFNNAKNSWAKDVLMILVKGYLDFHNVDYRVRAKLSSLFGFKYEPNTILPNKSIDT